MPAVQQEELQGVNEAYVPLSEKTVLKETNKLIKQFEKYAKSQNLSSQEVGIQKALLPYVIVRVDKRKKYFLIFHEGTKINEIKQAALTAYWILKFRPFRFCGNDPVRARDNVRLNEGFALFYILSACMQHAKEKGFEPTEPTGRLIDEIMYGFTYWDLSKEAIILIAETIGEAFYGIRAQGMPEHGFN